MFLEYTCVNNKPVEGSDPSHACVPEKGMYPVSKVCDMWSLAVTYTHCWSNQWLSTAKPKHSCTHPFLTPLGLLCNMRFFVMLIKRSDGIIPR